MPSEEVYYSFYEKDYERYYGKSTASKPNTTVEPPVFSVLQKYINIPSAVYLEVGPGRGLTLFHANRLFRKAMGVEPSLQFAKLLKENYGLQVTVGTVEKFVTDFKEKVDVIGMFHVLEHIYDPCASLIQMRDVMKENGLLVIEVPNILKPFRNLDSYFLRFVHPFNFSPTSLRNLLVKCGFEVLYVETGGDDWRAPQNITMIARKVAFKADIVLSEPGEYLKVIHILDAYRVWFNNSLRYKWMLFNLTRKPLKYFRKIKYKLNKLLNG